MSSVLLHLSLSYVLLACKYYIEKFAFLIVFIINYAFSTVMIGRSQQQQHQLSAQYLWVSYRSVVTAVITYLMKIEALEACWIDSSIATAVYCIALHVRRPSFQWLLGGCGLACEMKAGCGLAIEASLATVQ